MFTRQFLAFAILLSVHISLMLYAFGFSIINLNEILFFDYYDGLKNYYTFLYYTSIQDSDHIFRFYGMAYPYHDNILYTDCTPILALLAKVSGPISYSVGLYNGFFYLHFLLSPCIAFLIARQLAFKDFISIVFSLFIVWIHPMIFCWGEWTNLSLSIIFLLSCLVLLKASQNRSGFLWINISIFFLIVISSFLHLYYLPMLSLFIGTGLLVLFIIEKKLSFLVNILSLIVGAGSTLVFYLAIDSKMQSRPESAMGYDYSNYSLSISDYFIPYDYLNNPFASNSIELSTSYLGTYFIPLLILIGFFLFIHKTKRISINNPHKSILLAISSASVITLFTSLGSSISLFGSIEVYNFLNPFNYLVKFSEAVKHFRYIDRFSFPTFTGITIITSYFVNEIWKISKSKLIKGSILFILMLMLYDCLVTVDFRKGNFNSENLFNNETLHRDFPNLDSIDFQAILPIPYFHMGSETQGLILDDHNYWSQHMYQASIRYKKPLMANKTARAPIDNTEKLFSLFSNNPDDEIMGLLKDKDILVCIQKSKRIMPYKGEPAESAVDFFLSIRERWPLQHIVTYNNIDYYLMSF